MNVEKILLELLNCPENLKVCTISNPRDKKSSIKRIQIRTIRLKNDFVFHCSIFEKAKNTHRNIPIDSFAAFFNEQLLQFRQIFIRFSDKNVQVLIDKKGAQWIKQEVLSEKALPVLSHNEKKNYIIEEKKPLDFLIHLGIMKPDGTVISKMRNKFIQINRFLEIVSDEFSQAPLKDEYSLVDLGCGKGYLTFALYWWFENVLKKDVKILGIDSKKDVITSISELSKKIGYKNLSFLCSHIQDIEKPYDTVDAVLALHACDVATDYALEKAISWKTAHLFVAPCCQHEISKKLKKESFLPFQKYPILREKFCALYTDILRCEMLEKLGYKVTVLEFIDPEHTPKNLLIRATRLLRTKSQNNYADVLMNELKSSSILSQCFLEKKH